MSSPFCGWTITPTYSFLLDGRELVDRVACNGGKKSWNGREGGGGKARRWGVRAQEPLWRTLPTGGELRTRASGGAE